MFDIRYEMKICISTLRHKIYNWRASLASETLTGVTQSKIGDVCLLASERSERDTYKGNTIENRGCLFVGERAKRARQY